MQSHCIFVRFLWPDLQITCQNSVWAVRQSLFRGVPRPWPSHARCHVSHQGWGPLPCGQVPFFRRRHRVPRQHAFPSSSWLTVSKPLPAVLRISRHVRLPQMRISWMPRRFPDSDFGTFSIEIGSQSFHYFLVVVYSVANLMLGDVCFLAITHLIERGRSAYGAFFGLACAIANPAANCAYVFHKCVSWMCFKQGSPDIGKSYIMPCNNIIGHRKMVSQD